MMMIGENSFFKELNRSLEQLKLVGVMYWLLRTFLDEEQAMLISIMLLTIPLSYLMGLLKNKYLILGLSFTTSLVFQSIMFPTEKYILWAQQQIVYLLLLFCPRHIVGNAILFESFTYLAAVQIRRMYIAYAVNAVDVTGILMMQIFLYVGIGYNYQHGLKPDVELSEGARRRKIVERPDYLTYMGFVFFLPSCMVGPTFEYRDYEDYLNRKGDYQQIPSPIKAGLNELLIFLMTVLIYVGSADFELFYTITPEFADHGILYKLSYIVATITHIEFKYISAWSLGLISVHLSGFSYNATTNQFDKISITRIRDFFFEPSFKVKAECWNIPIQTALKRYIYETIYDPKGTYRDEKQKKKVQNKAQLSTLMTSAFWHGLYPGYFISFFHWMLYLRITQEFHRLRQKSEGIEKLWSVYKIGYIENLISAFVMTYFGVFFHIMTFTNIKIVLVATYALPFIVLYASHLLIVEMRVLKSFEKMAVKGGKGGKVE